MGVWGVPPLPNGVACARPNGVARARPNGVARARGWSATVTAAVGAPFSGRARASGPNQLISLRFSPCEGPGLAVWAARLAGAKPAKSLILLGLSGPGTV